MELVEPGCIQEQRAKVIYAPKKNVMKGWSRLHNEVGASWFVLFTKYYWHYRLYEDKMGRACARMGV